jgi:hypothetical protein
MLTRNTLRIVSLIVAGVAMAGASQAMAQGVGNVGSLPNLIQANTSATGWDIGVSSPLPVVLNPTGPAWQKILVGPNNLPVVANPGQTFYLHEVLVVGGNQPWTDWHEDLLNPYWDWTGTQILINNTVPAGLVINNTPGNGTQGGSVSFFFNPAPPGSTVDIFKQLTYQANPTLPVFSSKVLVNEYPTPEPATLGLLGLGSAVMLRRRNRRGVV